MTEQPIREITSAHVYVIPDLRDLSAMQDFVRQIITDTRLKVEFKVDTQTMTADIKIGHLNKLTVPDRGIILIIGSVVYALDRLAVTVPDETTSTIYGTGS